MKALARLSAVALSAYAVAAGTPVTASAQMAAPAAVSIQSGSAVVTVRTLSTGGIMFWVTKNGMQISGMLDAAEVEGWSKDASSLVDVGATVEEKEIGGVLGAKTEARSPWLFASNKSALMIDRLRRGDSESYNFFVTDADNENRLYFTLDRKQAGQVVEVLRDAAAMSRQIASASQKANGGPH